MTRITSFIFETCVVLWYCSGQLEYGQLIDAHVVSGQPVLDLALLLARSVGAFETHYVLECFNSDDALIVATSVQKCRLVFWCMSALVKVHSLQSSRAHATSDSQSAVRS